MTYDEFCALDELTSDERRAALVRDICGDAHPLADLCEWLAEVARLRAAAEASPRRPRPAGTKR